MGIRFHLTCAAARCPLDPILVVELTAAAKRQGVDLGDFEASKLSCLGTSVKLRDMLMRQIVARCKPGRVYHFVFGHEAAYSRQRAKRTPSRQSEQCWPRAYGPRLKATACSTQQSIS